MKNANLAGKSLVLLFILAGGLALLAYFYSTAGGKLPLAEKPYKVTAVLTDSQQVLKHADVRAAGVRIGEVGEIENVDGKVHLTLEIAKKHAPVYRDARVLVRQKTLVGENYIELSPGSAKASAIPDGGRLSVAAQEEAVPIDKVLNTLDPKTRERVSDNLRAGGDSVDGRGSELNELFDRVAPLAEDGSQLLDVLNRQRGQIARLIGNTGIVMGAIANRTNDLQSLVRSAKATSEAVAARDAAVQRTFEAIPPTLQQARSTVSDLTRFSATSTPVVNDLRTSLQSLKPVLSDLGPTAAKARKLTDELPALFKAMNPTLDSLKTFSNDGSAAVPAVEELLRELNPALKYIKPYNRDIGGFLSNFGAGGMLDKWGVRGRCQCPVSDRTIANWTPELRALVAPLLDNGPIASFQKETLNPYRDPGSLLHVDKPFVGKYPRIEKDTSPNTK